MEPADSASILQQILSRYENEENNFLEEVEAMQQQCANTDTSTDDVQEESTPVLGTLCNLVGEISHLRKENRKLRRRLFDSSTNQRSTTQVSSSSSASRKVVDRVNAFLEKSGRRNSTAFLPRLITTAVNAGTSSRSCLMSSGSSSGIFNQRSNTMEARHGARERLSSPPQKDCLTVSSYSADLSSDTLPSAYSRKKSTPKASPLVPEEMDSEMERDNLFHEVALPNHPKQIGPMEKEEIYQSSRSRRSMTRRSSRSQLSATDFSSLSEHTSPSSASASSSVEPNDHMTSSRSSFLELIGVRRKRDKLLPTSPCQPSDESIGLGKSVSLKKRKRKISGSDFTASCNPLANAEKRYSAIYMTENKGARARHESENLFEASQLDNRSEKSGATSVESMDKEVQRRSQQNSSTTNTANNAGKGACERRLRPKSMIYHNASSTALLDPTKIPAKLVSLKAKAKSCKSVDNSEQTSSSREASQGRNACEIDEALFVHFQHENSQLKNEIQLLKSRNNRLIDQLREKSMQMSHVQAQKNQLEAETQELRRKEHFNDLVDRLCLKKRFAHSIQTGFSSMEEKLYGFQKQILAMSEAFKNQQAAINASFREHSTYHEACLEQVERLQRENFSLLQLQAADLETQDKCIRQKIDLMPSYDALYSFTMGIVKKLGQLRKMLVEKSCRVNQTELELMNFQSSLLLTHAQVERLRLQLGIESCRPMLKRPASFHGDSFLDNLAKSEICFLLPIKLHGSRVQQQRKFQNSPNIDSLVEANEQNIEVEFLRLFDYARCLSKICEQSPPVHQKHLNRVGCGGPGLESVIHYRNGMGTVSPMNSPIFNDRKLACVAEVLPNKMSPIVQQSHRIGVYARETKAKTGKQLQQTSRFGAKRPMSWMDPSSYRSNIYSCKDDEFVFSTKENTPNSSPLLNLHKLSNLFGRGKSAGLCSTESNCGWRSPSTTPVLTRRVPLLGSSTKTEPSPSPKQQLKERRLVKQSSLQNNKNSDPSATIQTPLYDSPPRSNLTLSETGSSDYNTIGSFQLHDKKAKQGSHLASIFSKDESTCLDLNSTENSLKRGLGAGSNSPTDLTATNHQICSLQQHRPMPSAPPISLIHSAISKLPQPSSGSQPLKGCSLRRAAPVGQRDLLNKRPAIAHPASLQSSPLLMRQMSCSGKQLASRTSESPSFARKLVQTGAVFEENDPQSGQKPGCSETVQNSSSSKLPKPSLNTPNSTSAAAKKAGTSWLSRLRLNSTRKS